MVVRRQKRHSCAGFTVLELICAFAILSILGSVAFLGSTNSMQDIGRSWRETQALESASGQLERLRSRRTAPPPGNTTFELSASARAALPEARGQQHVEQLEKGLLRVRVKVSWQEPGGRRRHVELTTLLVLEVTR